MTRWIVPFRTVNEFPPSAWMLGKPLLPSAVLSTAESENLPRCDRRLLDPDRYGPEQRFAGRRLVPIPALDKCGAAVFNRGSLSIQNTTLSNNTSDGRGGAICNLVDASITQISASNQRAGSSAPNQKCVA